MTDLKKLVLLTALSACSIEAKNTCESYISPNVEYVVTRVTGDENEKFGNARLIKYNASDAELVIELGKKADSMQNTLIQKVLDLTTPHINFDKPVNLGKGHMGYSIELPQYDTSLVDSLRVQLQQNSNLQKLNEIKQTGEPFWIRVPVQELPEAKTVINQIPKSASCYRY